MSELTQIPPSEAGSLPLKTLKHELYARERALCTAPEQAAQRAGYAPRCGKCSQLERRKEVRARIAFLSRDDVELIREKRRRLEERLNLSAFANLMECAEVDETGKLVAIDWGKIKDSPLAPTIAEFSFDSKTGELTRFKRDDALNAIAQLRDMHGFKAPSRTELSGPEGAPVPVTSFTRIIVEPHDQDGESVPSSAGAGAI